MSQKGGENVDLFLVEVLDEVKVENGHVLLRHPERSSWVNEAARQAAEIPLPEEGPE
jgi:hypothetical protein